MHWSSIHLHKGTTAHHAFGFLHSVQWTVLNSYLNCNVLKNLFLSTIYTFERDIFSWFFIHCVLWVMKIKMKWDIWLWKKKMFKTSLFFRFLPTVMMLVFVEEDGVSVSLVFFRSRSSWATALLPILRQTVSNAMMNIFVQRRIYSKSLHLLWCCPHNIYVLWRAWEIGRKRTSSHENDHTCLVPIYAQNQ